MRVHCKACDNKPFNSISSLRKHQWAVHKEFYAAVGSYTKKEIVTIEANGLMSATQLLDKLKEQRDFMNDVVNLVERMITK